MTPPEQNNPGQERVRDEGGPAPNALGANLSQNSLEAKILGCTSQYVTNNPSIMNCLFMETQN